MPNTLWRNSLLHFLLAERAAREAAAVPGGDTGRTELPNPRAPPVLSDAEYEADGNGYIVMAGRRGPLGRRPWWLA